MSPRQRLVNRPRDFTVFLAGATLGTGFMAHAMWTTTDVWHHQLWSVFFAIASLANLVAVLGISNRALDAAAAFTFGAFASRPVGVIVEAIKHIPQPHVYLAVVIYTFFAFTVVFAYKRIADALARIG